MIEIKITDHFLFPEAKSLWHEHNVSASRCIAEIYLQINVPLGHKFVSVYYRKIMFGEPNPPRTEHIRCTKVQPGLSAVGLSDCLDPRTPRIIKAYDYGCHGHNTCWTTVTVTVTITWSRSRSRSHGHGIFILTVIVKVKITVTVTVSESCHCMTMSHGFLNFLVRSGSLKVHVTSDGGFLLVHCCDIRTVTVTGYSRSIVARMTVSAHARNVSLDHEYFIKKQKQWPVNKEYHRFNAPMINCVALLLSIHWQLRLILFIYLSSPLLFNKLLITADDMTCYMAFKNMTVIVALSATFVGIACSFSLRNPMRMRC